MNLFKKKLGLLAATAAIGSMVLAGCTGGSGSESESSSTEKKEAGVLNIYSSRHYDTDQELYKIFEQETGVKINVVEGKGDELIERLKREGKDTEADLLVTADAGMLHKAKTEGLFQSIESETIEKNIEEKLLDPDREWVGLTKRARVIVYDKNSVDPSELSTYEDLASEKWKNEILIRSSENIYNQSIMASFLELNGEEAAKNWASGIVSNMAREPQGGDTDQVKAVAAGEGKIAVANTYYVGKLINSSDPEEVKVGESVGVFFPNQETTGTHVNVTGAGIIKTSKNAENALAFLEFLSGEKAQRLFADSNSEYPGNPSVEPSETLKAWGEFKEQDINLAILGERNSEAVKIMNEVGWK
ncbi:iron uptake protein A1 precursor [Andreesenia angusta]|uniref:Iron uptake protein A1 n=1 Tax=Andreesenia angusta TaxID=39480 RepID=A0A1S1V5N4_9FIRM|nr:Fe(3+) ABC transporter substrate-binding protein [Andreesenia angusta]OHW61898.1 iron uptake protein A1 precursor [Andreesenia angusta]